MDSELLTFAEVAETLICTPEGVRIKVVEERQIPWRVVTLAGHVEDPGTPLVDFVDEHGSIFEMDLETGSKRHRGYIRVTRDDLEAYIDATGHRSRGLYGVGTPWPTHETKHLRALRAAALKFFRNADPTGDRVPTVKEIVRWLTEDYSQGGEAVTKTDATHMARFLRPDHTKPGPRAAGRGRKE